MKTFLDENLFYFFKINTIFPQFPISSHNDYIYGIITLTDSWVKYEFPLRKLKKNKIKEQKTFRDAFHFINFIWIGEFSLACCCLETSWPSFLCTFLPLFFRLFHPVFTFFFHFIRSCLSSSLPKSFACVRATR